MTQLLQRSLGQQVLHAPIDGSGGKVGGEVVEVPEEGSASPQDFESDLSTHSISRTGDSEDWAVGFHEGSSAFIARRVIASAHIVALLVVKGNRVSFEPIGDRLKLSRPCGDGQNEPIRIINPRVEFHTVHL